jgi:hypothetical protein
MFRLFPLFHQKNGQKLGAIISNFCQFFIKIDHSIGFQEKRHFSSKIALRILIPGSNVKAMYDLSSIVRQPKAATSIDQN